MAAISWLETLELVGLASDPPVSPDSRARIYYNSAGNQFLASRDEGPYLPFGSGAGPIGLHDTTHSPVGLWQFQDSLADTSGNGLNLSLSTGLLYYTTMWPGNPGARGWHFSPTVRLTHAADALLQITGDITIEMLLLLDEMPPSGSVNLVSYMNSGSLEANNILYRISAGTQSAFQLEFEQENGAGNVNRFQNGTGMPPARILHFAVTRTSNAIQYYIDGRAHGSPSTLANSPTGGSTSQLYVGADVTFTNGWGHGSMASLKIVASALSAAQIAAEYNRTLGPVFGTI